MPDSNQTTSRSDTSAPPVVRLTRHYGVPPQAVWRAWTDPQALSRWFGSGGPVLSAEADVRVGGRYQIRFTGRDGEVHQVGGTYREVAEPHKLAFSWAWHSTPERESLVTLTLSAAGGGTDMTLLHAQFFDQAASEGHARGWEFALGTLARHLEPVA